MVAVPLFAAYATNNRPVTITVDGQQINFQDQNPIMVSNRVLVPVRGVFEHMGFDVSWNYESRVARLERDGTVVIIPAEMDSFVVNSRIVTPDVPQRMVGNRMLLPLRAIAEALGGTAYWDNNNRVARIISNQDEVPSPTPSPTPTPTPEPEVTPETDDDTDEDIYVPRPTPVPPDNDDDNDDDDSTYNTSGDDNGDDDDYEVQNPTPTPTPEPTPEPTPTPTPEPTPSPEPTPTPAQQINREPFLYTTSQIQLPDRQLYENERDEWIDEYQYNGGASAFELQVVEKINNIRYEHGLNRLYINENLMMASRFYSQTLANLDLPLAHNVGPYNGAIATARAFGFTITGWSGGIGNGGAWSAEVIVTRWMESDTHRNFILAESHEYIGFGSQLGGRWGVFHYLILSRQSPSN